MIWFIEIIIIYYLSYLIDVYNIEVFPNKINFLIKNKDLLFITKNKKLKIFNLYDNKSKIIKNFI